MTWTVSLPTTNECLLTLVVTSWYGCGLASGMGTWRNILESGAPIALLPIEVECNLHEKLTIMPKVAYGDPIGSMHRR